MDIIICVFLCVFTILLLRFVFKINLKKAKQLEDNKDLNYITNRFPSNLDIAKEMLEMLGNNSVQVEEQKNTKTSLYIAITNKILIADLKNHFARIQTIAHECIHSVQDRRLLLFNFIFSNITIICFTLGIVLTICNIYTNYIFQLFVLLLLFFIQFAVRSFLEIDAMTKSKYLAKEYIEDTNLCTNKETEELIKEYEKINKMGILFYLFWMITNLLLRISLYIIISAFC